MAIPDGFWSANLEATTDRMNQNLLQFDVAGNRPSAASGQKGMMFVATDTGVVSYDNGGAWVVVGNFGQMSQAEAEGGTDTAFQLVSALRIAQAVLQRLALTTKGDIVAYSTLPIRVAIGDDNSVLTADSTEAAGLKWASASGDLALSAVNYSRARLFAH